MQLFLLSFLLISVKISIPIPATHLIQFTAIIYI